MVRKEDIQIQLKLNSFEKQAQWGALEEEAVLEILGEILAGSDVELREKALLALESFPGVQTEALILKCLNLEWATRLCLRTLGNMGSSAVLGTLLRYAKSEKFTLKWEALDAIESLVERGKIEVPSCAFASQAQVLIEQTKAEELAKEEKEPAENSINKPFSPVSDLEVVHQERKKEETFVRTKSIRANKKILPSLFCFLHQEMVAQFLCESCGQMLCIHCAIRLQSDILCERCAPIREKLSLSLASSHKKG